MKAMVIEHFGGANELKMREIPTPHPKAQEVQIQIAYTAVNPVDWKIREGLLKERLPHEFPLILGWDASGIISEVGEGVTQFRPGDKVFAYCRQPKVKWGTYAEYICVPADSVARMPKQLNFAEAAAIPLTGLTAWQALFDFAKLSRGQTVFIQAGAGGVGGLAIQFAKQVAQAKVITTARQENHDYFKSLGADEVIDYTKEDVEKRVREMAPEGVDVAFDCVGGKGYDQCFHLVTQGGHLVSIVNPNLDKAAAKQRGITADYVFVSPNGKQLAEISQLIEQGKVKPPHIEELNLADAAQAQEKSKDGHTRGKIVLKVR